MPPPGLPARRSGKHPVRAGQSFFNRQREAAFKEGCTEQVPLLLAKGRPTFEAEKGRRLQREKQEEKVRQQHLQSYKPTEREVFLKPVLVALLRLMSSSAGSALDCRSLPPPQQISHALPATPDESTVT